MSTLLKIEDLSVTYRTESGDLPAVRGVDLTVERGEVVGVAGESGCGKSTVASTILRLQPPSATVTGRVAIARPIPDDAPVTRAEVHVLGIA